MTKCQSESLECLQRASLKTIFGFTVSYSDCLDRAGIPTLKDRRWALFQEFTIKAYKSERFKEGWFENRSDTGHNLRKKNVVEETFARCERLQRAPIFEMQKLVNKLSTEGII